ncbi:1-(5-phosphoribosyl)-5-[(5-phosphoribosylamino)methylideneamino]imidazole-4-carboxamide isomerase [Methanofollis fontis]|uniref:1-(5-phosphoribosyl)-5-[(5-phosphoribosylamino)methylideneamino] imidazole-4-carboxamide isomerase n=1 Tax=Methanofollis fontis TaxID=2052832 RepID=A0A483CTK9_9EURY|nr:1-(5-phosphoribosyl)-5-[(5-phosphoribosylamino)methylideneamino]imidazole-4-carboxamide isomerase [Methanofollis fontis]TAJ44608.1 1-(5-phosphoribosyl)-5-[(5-phosphoribosylamino)methylideneamino]imidazole-4-carboxamide isomerase [Methanofollis fontis]
MMIFPAVDILGGQCVQLVQGRRESATAYGTPLENARRWLDAGADALHVINLDGAFGSAGANAAVIRDLIQETGVFVELGGGIRSMEDARSWLDIGVGRVILGTIAVREPEIVRDLSLEYGPEQVMAGVDAREGRVVIEGWEEEAGDFLSWAERFELLGAGSLLYTNVSVEGLCQGIDTAPVAALLGRTHLPVVVAGGISSTADVRTLRDLGVAGAVLGSALYSGKIMLEEALEAAR